MEFSYFRREIIHPQTPAEKELTEFVLNLEDKLLQASKHSLGAFNYVVFEERRKLDEIMAKMEAEESLESL